MKRIRHDHPVFDQRQFKVNLAEVPRWREFYVGHPAVLLDVLESLAKKHRDRVVTGEELHDHLERNRTKLFPESRHEDVVKLFQDYRARFERSNILAIAA